MHLALYFAGEVKVDIRGLIAVEPEEGFKRNVVPVVVEFVPATGTDCVGKIKAGTDILFLCGFKVAVFGIPGTSNAAEAD